MGRTVSPTHRRMVADNVRSMPTAWMRATYADETLIGFIMTHTDSDYEAGIDCPGVFLWRFMIRGLWQGKGYVQQAPEKFIQHLEAMGVPLLHTSCGQGESSPKGFYCKLGFVPTGETYSEDNNEIKLVFRLNDYKLPSERSLS